MKGFELLPGICGRCYNFCRREESAMNGAGWILTNYLGICAIRGLSHDFKNLLSDQRDFQDSARG